jgi:hypothetical protein
MEQPQDPSVPPVDQQNPAPAEKAQDPQPPADVSQELFNKYKSDAQKYQSDLKAKEAELESMKMAKLKEAKNWQEIARIKEDEATAAKQEAQNLKSAIVNQHKSMALRAAALKAGINPASLDDLDILDFDEVSVETTSQGKILVNGADLAIGKLKTLRPHWFLKNPSAVNPQSPEVRIAAANGAGDLNNILALEKEYKKNPQNSEARKAYESALRQYRK